MKLRSAIDLKSAGDRGRGDGGDGDMQGGMRVMDVLDGEGGGKRARRVRAQCAKDAAGGKRGHTNSGAGQRGALAGVQEGDVRGGGREEEGGRGGGGVAHGEREGGVDAGGDVAKGEGRRGDEETREGEVGGELERGDGRAARGQVQ